MDTPAPTIEELRSQLIEALTAEVTKHETELAHLDEQRAEIKANLTTARKELKALDPDTAPSGEEFHCDIDGCDKTSATARGMSQHKKLGHKTKTPEGPKPDGGPLRCSSCDHGLFSSVKLLAKHTLAVHGYEPTREERTPVKAAA